MPTPLLRLGTRGSPLALIQARMVRAALCTAHGWGEDAVEIVTIITTGDKVQDRALAEIGGKSLWTKELDRALTCGDIDCAVHSMKDVETIRPDAITIVATLPRADVRDRLIGAESINALRDGAVVGTSSPRRAAQLLRLRPDLKIVLLRGNVDTRLAKLAAEEVDATLLAGAGLIRLGRADVGVAIPTSVMLPAPAQGAVGIEALANKPQVQAWIAAINDAPTHQCVAMERALLAALAADCHSPVGALATLEKGDLAIRAELLSEDGRAYVTGEASGSASDLSVAKKLAQDLLNRAPETVRRLFEG